MPRTIYQATNRVKLLQALIDRLAKMKSKDKESMDKDLIAAKSLRVEIRLMGYAPTKYSDWLTDEGGLNLDRLGKYLDIRHLQEFFGVGIEVSYLPVQRMLDTAQAELDKVDLTGSDGNPVREEYRNYLRACSKLLGIRT